MSKEKQIKTTDWLTRGMSKEQLEREKREAIMSADLQECITYDEWSAREYGIDSIDFDTTAEKMVAKGYRKQSVGEWKLEHETYGKMRCSVCGKECPTERKPDPYEDYQMTDFYVTSPFCPNCGARMKGGAEQ